MGGILRALAISVALHAALALGLAAWIGGANGIELATLDLSAVEVSFAEEVQETAPTVSMPSRPPSAEAPRPEDREPPQDPIPSPPPTPPDPSATPIPEPVPEKPPVFEELPPETRENMGTVPEDAGTVPESAAPRQAKVDAPAKPKKAIRPDYPKGARQRGEEGDVVLEIVISAQGKVEGARIVASCGYPELDAAAERAVRRAQFVPAKSGDAPVSSTARIVIAFKLK